MSGFADSPMVPTVDRGEPKRYEAQRAPTGGVTIDGQFFKGGEFIPGEVADSPEGQAAIKAAKEQPADAPPSGPAAGEAKEGATGRVEAGPVKLDLGALPNDPKDFVEKAGLASQFLGHMADGATGTVREIYGVGNDFFHNRFRAVMAKHGPLMGPLVLAAGMAGYAAGMAAPVAAPIVGGMVGGLPGALAGGSLLGADIVKMGMPGDMLGKGEGPVVAPLSASIGAAMAAAPFIAAHNFLKTAMKSGWDLTKAAASGVAQRFSAEDAGDGLDIESVKRLAAEDWQEMLGQWFEHVGHEEPEDEFEEEEFERYAAEDWTEEQAPRAKSGKRWRNKATGKVTYTDPTQAKGRAKAAPKKPSGEKLGGEGKAEAEKPAAQPVEENVENLRKAYLDARRVAADTLHAAQQNRQDPEALRQATAAQARVKQAEFELEQAQEVDRLAQISSKALDKAYGYGVSKPGTFGHAAGQGSVKAFLAAKRKGVQDLEGLSSAIHDGWGGVAKTYDDPAYKDKPEKKEHRLQLANTPYDQLPEEEKEKDRVLARALMQDMSGGSPDEGGEKPPEPGFSGVDRLGRQWQNGKLVAKQKPVPGASAGWKTKAPGQGNPYPKGSSEFEHAAWEEGNAGGYTNGFTPGTPEHAAWEEGADARKGGIASAGASKPTAPSGKITPEGRAAAEKAKAKREGAAKAVGQVNQWSKEAAASKAQAGATKKVDAGPVKMDMNTLPKDPQSLLGKAKDLAAATIAGAEKMMVGAPPELQRAGDNFWGNGFEGIFRAHGVAKGALIVAAGLVGGVAGGAVGAAPAAGLVSTFGPVLASLQMNMTPLGEAIGQMTVGGAKVGGWLASAPFAAASMAINRAYYGAKNMIGAAAGKVASDIRKDLNDPNGSATGGPRMWKGGPPAWGPLSGNPFFGKHDGSEHYAVEDVGSGQPIDMEEIKKLAAETWADLMSKWYEEAGRLLQGEESKEGEGAPEGAEQHQAHRPPFAEGPMSPPTDDVEQYGETEHEKEKVRKTMSEFKAGTLKSGSGHPVTNRQQALAIAMSQAGIAKK